MYQTVNVVVVPGKTKMTSCGPQTPWEAREVRGCKLVGAPIATAPTKAEAYRKARQEDKRLRVEANTKFRFHG